MRICILGAGASKADGIPLTCEFFPEVFKKFGGRLEDKPSLRGLPFNRDEVVAPILKRFDAYHELNLYKEWQRYLTTGYHAYPLPEGDTEKIEKFFTEIYGGGALIADDKNLLQKLYFLFFHILCHAAINSEGKNYRRFIDQIMMTRPLF